MFFSLFTAICFVVVVVVSVPFHAAGFGAKISLVISAAWLLGSVPVGCALGAWLRRRSGAND